MIESATGIILRTRLLTETSLIIHWLTPHWGRIATVAKGARRNKSLFAGKVDLFYRADFSFSRSRNSDLHYLREVKLQGSHGAIREDLGKLQQAAYAAALVELTTEADTPLPEIFQLIAGYLQHLCEQKNSPPQNVFALELKMLRELGMEPDLEASSLTPGARKIVHTLVYGDWADGLRLKLSDAQSDEVGLFLHRFLVFNLGKLPRGRASAVAQTE